MTIITSSLFTLWFGYIIAQHFQPGFRTPTTHSQRWELGAQVTLRHLKNHIVAHSDLGLSYEERGGRGGARNLNWGSSDGIWTENLSSDFPERLRLGEILPANWTVRMKSKVLRQSCVLGPARWSLFCHYRRWSGRYCGQMRRWQDAWLRGSGPKSPRIRVCGWKWCAKHNGNPNFDGW